MSKFPFSLLFVSLTKTADSKMLPRANKSKLRDTSGLSKLAKTKLNTISRPSWNFFLRSIMIVLEFPTPVKLFQCNWPGSTSFGKSRGLLISKIIGFQYSFK